MRIVVCVLAMAVVGCADDAAPAGDPYCGNGHADPGEQCEPYQPYCSAGCVLENVAVTVHWSFATLSGGASVPCLAGDPDVEVHFTGPAPGLPGYGSIVMSSPCAPGELQLETKAIAYSLWLRSVADHEYRSIPFFVNVMGPGDLPPILTYSDAGYTGVTWRVYDAQGSQSSCNVVGIASVRLVIDDGALMGADAPCSQNGIGIGPILAGTHSLRVEGLDGAGNIVTTSSSVAVDVQAGGTAATVAVELHVP